MKRLFLVLTFALLTAACASGTSDTTTSAAAAPDATDSTSPATDPSPSPPPSAEAPSDSPPGTTGDAQKPPPEGPPAPDFTTVLASGESFTLSNAVKPVYMIFWAEW